MTSKSELDKLMTQGFITFQEVNNYIHQMKQLLEEFEPDFSRSALSKHEDDSDEEDHSGAVNKEKEGGFEPKRSQQSKSKEQQKMKPLGQHQVLQRERDSREQEGGSAENSSGEDEQEEDVICLEESQILSKYYEVNALRPVICAEPGRLPFRNDQHRKLQQYRKEWTNNPAPGEKRRDDLRWQVRDEMTKRDIPTLKLFHKSQLKPPEVRKGWVP